MAPELDWGTSFSAEEWATLQGHYDQLMGAGQLDKLAGFIPFMHDVRPDALKRYRLVASVVSQGIGLSDGMQNPPAVSMMAGHYNSTLPYALGIESDLFVAKQVGGRRQEVADILALAWLHAGMNGMNTAASVCRPLLDAWLVEDDGPGLTWPSTWEVDNDAFRCGIDFEAFNADTPVSRADIEKIERWHRTVQGAVPTFVTFFAEHYPLALIAFRSRFETSVEGTLPKQFIALCLVHLAACWKQPDSLRRSLHMARHFGVAKEHAVQTLAYSQMFLGDLGMDGALAGAEEVFVDWK